MLFRKRVLIAVTIGMALTGLAAQAQGHPAPLIVVPYEGETNYVYADGQFQPMDFCQPEENVSRPQFFAYSPDGSQFVFRVTPADAWLGGMLYLCDLQTHELNLIAEQPAPDILRTNAVWSPDGTQMVWIDANQKDYSMQVVVYNPNDGASTVIYERAARSLGFQAPVIDWSNAGIALFDILEQDGLGKPVVVIVDPVSGESNSYLIENPSLPEYGRWIKSGEDDLYLLNATTYNELTVLDPKSGEIRTMYGRLEFYNPAAPDGLALLAEQTDEIGAYRWSYVGDDFSGSLELKGNEFSIALSPDAQEIAFATFENYPWGGRAYTIHDFSTYPPQSTGVDDFETGYNIPGALYVFWGPRGLRVQQES
ncbi:MAG: hypothetical protein K8L99_28570 [Anaerolineae bacterium]|nr:hypothetical protein [Anaerolineae bacterium]